MLITPEYIAELIDFYPGKQDYPWKYDQNGTDMRNLQVKGAARIYNLLDKKKIALLADEVGMGKTIQSLAVCAALWHEKPDAKILILAPRDEIARNWEKEYQSFVRSHYRHNDNIIKSASGNQPVKKMIYSPNLYSLVHELQQGWGQLFIGKISSLSSLMAKKNVISWLEDLNIKGLAKVKKLVEERPGSFELNGEIIKLLKKEINELAEEKRSYFDLVIIDEAHYFRKKNGDSLRVNSATELFGNPSMDNYFPLSRKTLLLTATPNHSSSKDIENIVSYFTNEFSGSQYKTILDKICVRRLRRLGKNGYNKYNYRDELASPSDFRENPLSEMFFGLYQHELAKEVSKTKKEGNSGKGVSRMMKYLEGIEFIPFEKSQPENEEINEDSKSISTDYSKGTDATILHTISKKFREFFDEDPKHPKYNKIVEDLTLKHNNEKVVVFVRRIPSVFEISKRVIEHYDKRFWESLRISGFETLSFEKLDRKSFKNYSSLSDEISEEEEVNEIREEEDRNIPSSIVLNLFRIIKNDSVKSTHASNFRLRFNHSKPTVYAMFFCPGEDYFNSPYHQLISYKYSVGKELLENYYSSSLIHRTELLLEKPIAKDIRNTLLSKNPEWENFEIRDVEIPTLLTIFWDQYLSDVEICDSKKKIVLETYSSFNTYEREAFSGFLEKGTLLASEGVVWLYQLFRKIQKEQDDKPLISYLQFCFEVKSTLRVTLLYGQIQDSILHFRDIYKKIFSLNGNRELIAESWDSFNNAQPIYPYNSDNSNQKVLRCFNTPFYPDILVATSVLQEGVNLQYFCNTIYHYGMAWTPGDNEQRIGRVDRMFGKIERLLDLDNTATLNIYYPYLKDTIDEEQLARFAKRKFKEEALIDQGKAFEELSEINLQENDNDAWKQFLRKPDENSLSDPFPAEVKHFEGITAPKRKNQAINFEQFYYSISSAIRGLETYNPEIYFVKIGDDEKLLIDPTLVDKRKQPVIIEILLDHIGSGFQKHSVYCLRMRTPLAGASKYKNLIQIFNSSKSIQKIYLPTIKLCLDPSHSGGSNWGLYMSYEIPLFMVELEKNPLSIGEIQEAFVNLIKCADQTELELFNKDLTKEELSLPLNIIEPHSSVSLRRSREQKISDKWQKINSFYILEEFFDSQIYTDIEKQALINNHQNLYIKTIKKEKNWCFQVAHLTTDAQKQELDVLEKHLLVMHSNLKW